MAFLVLDRSGYPLVDPVTGLFCQFDTQDEAEAYREANLANQVMAIAVPQDDPV